MTAREITKALRGHWSAYYGLCFCPCHDDGRTPALKVSDDPRKDDGIDLHCFAGCDWKIVKDELRRQGLLPDRGHDHGRTFRYQEVSRRKIQPPPRPSPDNEAKAAFAKRIWAKTRPATGTPVETYLASRGITIEPPATLRYCPALKHGLTGLSLPVMVAAVTTWPNREVVGLHRTFLTVTGESKAPVSNAKMMLGPCSGGTVRPAPAGGELVLAEGIETALSILQATGKPVWACLSTSGLKTVILPPEVRTVIIAADGDEPGEKAAEEAASRFYREGRTVRIAKPPAGLDFNDLAMMPSTEPADG